MHETVTVHHCYYALPLTCLMVTAIDCLYFPLNYRHYQLHFIPAVHSFPAARPTFMQHLVNSDCHSVLWYLRHIFPWGSHIALLAILCLEILLLMSVVFHKGIICATVFCNINNTDTFNTETVEVGQERRKWRVSSTVNCIPWSVRDV